MHWLWMMSAVAGPVQLAAPLDTPLPAVELTRSWLDQPQLQLVEQRISDRAIQLRPMKEGVPVAGPPTVIRYDSDGRVRFAWVEEPIDADVNPVPTLSAAHALTAFPAATDVTEPELLIDAGRNQLVWRYRAVVDGEGLVAFVDAHTGAVRAKALRAHALGRVFPERFGESEDVELQGAEDGLVTEQVSVQSYSADGPVSHAIADSSGDYLFDVEPHSVVDPFPEVNAYYHLTQLADWWDARFDKQMPGTVSMLVNFEQEPGVPYDNAYFTYGLGFSYALTFGQGQSIDYATLPDIIAHELAHGVVEDASNLLETTGYPINIDNKGWHVAPGGLVEGLPDYFAASYYGDPLLAEGYDGDDALRNLDNELRCPEDLFGEAHADGEIAGGAMWAVRVAVGADAADQAVYEALSDVGESPSFAKYTALVLDSLQAQVDDGTLDATAYDAAYDALELRGMHTCDRAMLVTEEAPVTTLYIGVDVVSESICDLARDGDIRLTPAVQFRFEPPEYATSLTVRFDHVATSGEPLTLFDQDYEVGIRSGKMVTMTIDELDFLGFALNYHQDFAKVDATVEGAPSEVTITTDDVSFDEDLYLTLLGTNCKSTKTTTSVEWETDPPDAVADADEKGGCGCASTGGMAAAWLLPLLVVLGRRRRGSSVAALSGLLGFSLGCAGVMDQAQTVIGDADLPTKLGVPLPPAAADLQQETLKPAGECTPGHGHFATFTLPDAVAADFFTVHFEPLGRSVPLIEPAATVSFWPTDEDQRPARVKRRGALHIHAWLVTETGERDRLLVHIDDCR